MIHFPGAFQHKTVRIIFPGGGAAESPGSTDFPPPRCTVTQSFTVCVCDCCAADLCYICRAAVCAIVIQKLGEMRRSDSILENHQQVTQRNEGLLDLNIKEVVLVN